MWPCLLNFGTIYTVTTNRTLPLSITDKDLVLSKADPLVVRKVRRQCPSLLSPPPPQLFGLTHFLPYWV